MDLVTIRFRQVARFTDVIWDARNCVVAALRTAPAEEDNSPAEETALEKAVVALIILSRKKWQGSRSRGSSRPRGGQGEDNAWHCDNPQTCSHGWEMSRPGVETATPQGRQRRNITQPYPTRPQKNY